MPEYRMPSLGADMKDGRVVEWFVAPGDRVRRGDVVGVVDTAKGAIEMEIWEDATIVEIVAAPGSKVPVGEVLLRLENAEGVDEAGGEIVPETSPETVAEGAVEVVEVTAEPVAREGSGEHGAIQGAPPGRVVRASPAARKRAQEFGIDLTTIRGSGPEGAVVLSDLVAEDERPLHVTPIARRIAETQGIDLASVHGTGPHGTITRGDVEPLVTTPDLDTQPSSSTDVRTAAGSETHETEDRHRLMRAAIAEAMARSKREIPHYYLGAEAEMGRADAWLAAENAKRPPETRILPVALLLKSVALAARDFPEMNGYWTDGGYHAASSVHVGLAVSLRGGGLVAPALRDTDARPLDELSVAVTDLVQRARAGRLRSSEMTDGTLTVTSLGDRGVETVYGVIYPPQVAIVGFGRVVERPWAEDGLLGVRRTVSVTLAADHRASDGHRGGLFLRRIAYLLSHPEEL